MRTLDWQIKLQNWITRTFDLFLISFQMYFWFVTALQKLTKWSTYLKDLLNTNFFISWTWVCILLLFYTVYHQLKKCVLNVKWINGLLRSLNFSSVSLHFRYTIKLDGRIKIFNLRMNKWRYVVRLWQIIALLFLCLQLFIGGLYYDILRIYGFYGGRMHLNNAVMNVNKYISNWYYSKCICECDLFYYRFEAFKFFHSFFTSSSMA